MNTTATRRFAQLFALSAVFAGIVAGAVALAGTASAGTYSHDMTPHPTTTAPAPVTAHPAPGAHPHHGIPHLTYVQPDYHR
ncbi:MULTISPECIES: hypothetical protein [unclassified Mycobacterium]|uniref:hypothetical protein n=1 Tax=unclassified Mycobacterium TaxID=2642494 RepID=UPI00073FF11D|nr:MULTISPECIES: hypothetical protein [unclassified Mycobacterium]KUH85719.1 hypothetical protein AU186_23595 [Mycobacterium sp. GA-1999]KUH91576.1 hypothetical protein AU185_10660 [Mycobacterium sp. GA-0227b]